MYPKLFAQATAHVLQLPIVAMVVFLMVKLMNSVRRKEAEAPSGPPTPTPSEALLTEIRDLLQARG